MCIIFGQKTLARFHPQFSRVRFILLTFILLLHRSPRAVNNDESPPLYSFSLASRDDEPNNLHRVLTNGELTAQAGLRDFA